MHRKDPEVELLCTKVSSCPLQNISCKWLVTILMLTYIDCLYAVLYITPLTLCFVLICAILLLFHWEENTFPKVHLYVRWYLRYISRDLYLLFINTA